MEIIVDAMGGDNAPKDIVLGCIQAIKEKDNFNISLVGKEDEIKKVISDEGFNNSRLKIVNASEVITSEDVPTKAVKSKKDSSMVVGLNMIKENKGDVFVSAGNTGALMTASLLLLGRIKGVDRPALSFFFPTQKGPVLIIDVGANMNCKPENYFQFGIMGSIYMKEIFGFSTPKVGLLNVGTESLKGNEVLKQAHKLLSEGMENFSGNVESRDIPFGVVDVVVCDGFIGNILLKFLEGVASYFFDSLKEVYSKNIISKLSALAIKDNLRGFKKKMDYTEYGGVPLLGIDGQVIKAHGSSNAKAIKNSIFSAVTYGKSSVVKDITNKFTEMGAIDID